MSLSSTNNQMNYTGNGSTEVFPYTFTIRDDSWIEATVKETASGEETLLVITTDYTVSGVDDSGGGNVTLVDVNQDWLDADGDLDSGWTLHIRRIVPLTQALDLRNGGPYHPENVEDQFDKQTMVDQQQQNEIDRSLKLPVSVDPDDFSVLLPGDIEDSPGQLISVNEDGDGLELLSPEDVIYNLNDGGPIVVADSQAATNVTGWTLDAANFSSAWYLVEYTRSTTIMGLCIVILTRMNGVWYIYEGSSLGAGDHGFTFSVTESVGVAQVRVAADNTGAGTIKWKGIRVDA